MLRHAGLPAATVAYLACHSTPKTQSEKKTWVNPPDCRCRSWRPLIGDLSADPRTPCPCITTNTTHPYD